MRPRRMRKSLLPFLNIGSDTPAGILELIESHYDTMSPALQAVANYILDNPATFVFLPVQELAAKALVSHATVIRFCKSLGYKGFYEFSRDVQQVVQAELSSVTRLDITQDFLDTTGADFSFLNNIIEMEIKGLMSIRERISQGDVQDCAKMLAKADKIFVLGFMASHSLALHMEQMLSKITDNVTLIPSWSLQTIAFLHRMTPDSVLIAFSFPRYPKATVDFVTEAREHGCKIIAITNSPRSPIAKQADRVLSVPVGVLSYVDLYAAPMSVGTALALEFSRLDTERTTEKLMRFDKVVVRQNIYTR